MADMIRTRVSGLLRRLVDTVSPALDPDGAAELDAGAAGGLRVLMLPDATVGNPYQLRLVEALRRRGIDVELAQPEGILPLLGVVIARWPVDVLHIHWTHRLTLGRNRLVSVLTSTRFLTELAVIRLAGVRIVWTAHNLLEHERRFPRLELRTLRLAARICNRIIVHGPEARRTVAHGLSLPLAVMERLRCVPHGHFIGAGSGSHLWPLSRNHYPKQFQPVCGETTMLQATVRRLEGVPGRCGVIALAYKEHRFLVAQQIREAADDGGEPTVILEPAGRNTAPATALAAMHALDTDPEAVLLVMPSDHLIGDEEAFREAVGQGRAAAERGRLVAFGVVPDRPETGYGYIRAADGPVSGVRPVLEFVEKPGREAARRYVDSGNYHWNSGVFLFRADVYLAALEQYRPDVHGACRRAYRGRRHDTDFVRLGAEAFAASPAISVDQAVMEHTAEGRRECTVHRRVYRPWGAYEGVARSGRFQVKRIVVDPGQSLSLQMHHHRAEHWVVVSGTARVTRGEESFLLTEDQSAYIPLGVRHRLENTGVIPLEVIEVQTGSYLGEDDIVRFDDVYGRAPGKSAAALHDASG